MYLIKRRKKKYGDRVYISGPISIDPEAARRSFAHVESRLRAAGFHQIVNPEARLRGLDMSHGELLRVCRELLKGCDVIVLHGDWRHSTGACMEVGMALVLGIDLVEYDGENFTDLNY